MLAAPVSRPQIMPIRRRPLMTRSSRLSSSPTNWNIDM